MEEGDYVQQFCEDYKISPTHGFLLQGDLPELPKKYHCWVEIVTNLSQLLKEKRLRCLVDKLPVIDTDEISGYRMLRHAHLILSFLTNGYVWQNGELGVPECIPRQLAIPLTDVSKKVQLPPVLVHADAVLTNYTITDHSKPLSLENMHLRYRLSGDLSCDWFYLATAEVELRCVRVIQTILKFTFCVNNKKIERAIALMQNLSQQIEIIREGFMRMHEQLDGAKFYNTVRPYLNGWHEQGLIYEGVSSQPLKAYGGSAAQCTGIQAIDIFLGIEHESDKKQFLREMRKYMPAVHSQFLYKLETVCSTKKFVQDSGDAALCDAYNGCICAMVKLRSTHIQMVVKYITIQAPIYRDNSYDLLKRQGTGGQNLLPFLKNIRHTTQTSIGNTQ